MKTARIDVRSIRREQIVEAAVAVIAEQGLENLSLSEIESRAGMSRGQLTYYFRTKEAILLAVFDRLLSLSYARLGTPAGQEPEQASALDWIAHLLARIVGEPPLNPAFNALQYTFLAQIGRRDDFRERLATLYEEWRSHMARGLAEGLARLPGARRASPRAVASLVQALLHGLAMQAAADPAAFDRQEMVNLCLDVLGTYLRVNFPPRKNGSRLPAKNGSRRTKKDTA